MKKRGIGILIISIILGMIIGSLIGEVIGFICPAGVVKQFFTKSVVTGFGPMLIDLVVIKLNVGLHFKINITSILGIVIAVYYFRWY